MAQTFDAIDDTMAHWLAEQPLFFVGTAPLAAGGHINVSPKGMVGTFVVLGERRVAYLDFFGSGTETIAHLRENGRIVLMFCAFEGRPRIVRLHGTGRVVLVADPEFAALRREFAKGRTVAQRSVVVVDVDRIADSCGFSVPLMEYVADRDVLDVVQEKRGASAYADPAVVDSIDGLPGVGRRTG
jgi:hypothetical protein